VEISSAAVTLVIGMLALLALLVIYAAGVGKRVHMPIEGVPTGNPAMERKVVAVLALTIVTGLLLVGYGFWEPTRQAVAADRQENRSIERAIDNYTTLCMGCHGVDGRGAVVPDSNPPRVAPQLNREDLRPTDPDQYKDRYKFVYNTISRGRPGTPMPTWGKEDGGTLIAEQVYELALMITKGDKELQGTETVWDKIRAVAREKIAHGSPEPKVPEVELAADCVGDCKAGADIWKGKGACIGCHTINGVGGQTGPEQSHIATVGATRKPGVSAEDYIRESILQPNAFLVPGYPPVMPSFQGVLSDKEIDQIITYFMTLK